MTAPLRPKLGEGEEGGYGAVWRNFSGRSLLHRGHSWHGGNIIFCQHVGSIRLIFLTFSTLIFFDFMEHRDRVSFSVQPADRRTRAVHVDTTWSQTDHVVQGLPPPSSFRGPTHRAGTRQGGCWESEGFGPSLFIQTLFYAFSFPPQQFTIYQKNNIQNQLSAVVWTRCLT